MTDKELNSHDLAREIEIVKLQQENKELKLELSGYRQAILKDKEMLGLKEENDKLKKQLELGEEHNKLKEEITNLSKDVDMWNAKYNDMFDENRMLKKQVEEYKRLGFKHLNDKCNKLENQQKEFINYLEDEKDRLARECSNIYEDSLGNTRLVNADKFDEVNDILQKYRSIIGGDALSELIITQ